MKKDDWRAMAVSYRKVALTNENMGDMGYDGNKAFRKQCDIVTNRF